MISKIFILLLTASVIGMYFVSFGGYNNHTTSLSMMRSAYKIDTEVPVMAVSIMIAIGSLCFAIFGLKYLMDCHVLWPILLAAAIFAICLLVWKQIFGIHSSGWGWSIFLSIVCTVVTSLCALDNANLYIDPSYRIPE